MLWLNVSLTHLMMYATTKYSLFTPSTTRTYQSYYLNQFQIAKSFYSFICSYSPINMKIKSSKFQMFSKSPIFIDSNQEQINNQNFSTSYIFTNELDTSTSIVNCIFENCSNYYGDPGGAIYYRRSSNLTVTECQFIYCSTNGEAGAIYVQEILGGWINGDVKITHCLFHKCYSSSVDHYKSGVLLVHVGARERYFEFHLYESTFEDCQSDPEQENKIVEGQGKLYANNIKVEYVNMTNNNDKTDITSAFFSKHIEDSSIIHYMKLINQVCYSVFECYDMISMLSINFIDIVNCSFIYNNNSNINTRLAVFNIYYLNPGVLNIENIYVVSPSVINKFYSANPEIIVNVPQASFAVIHAGSDYPTISNCFTNDDNTKMVTAGCIYEPLLTYENGKIINPYKEATSTFTIADEPTDIFTDNNIDDNIIDNSDKLSPGAISGIVIGAVVVVVLIVLFIVCFQKRKKKRESCDDTSVNNLENEAFQETKKPSQLFTTPISANFITQTSVLSVETSEDPFRNDIDEHDTTTPTIR
ncbi:hypothetical protein TRFO_11786 [Tritrichomonas foetus]|uniref:Right handed beta helix domain-containing protein n=1 Tax=Tritrichomonas foetus TaxID=1144522 RepID=A0A1J4J6V3_9EUKA|nr:hypothetical protein TRFO_11786 [Tritrichomonas foetus]|eukprot:OHS93387.1 hypothetical protein TRFO_11786 [Tritrichomonas foetus]